MAQINGLVELLNTLLLSSHESTVTVDKTTLSCIKNCSQDSKDTLEFLQLESQVQQEDLQHKIQHSEPVSVQKFQHIMNRGPSNNSELVYV